MKRFALLLLMVFFLCHVLSAQQFHAFLFCKTFDETIGPSATVNYGKMGKQMQLMATALGMPFVEHSVLGSRFTASEVDKELANVKIEKDDIVILYISSHGAKSEYDSNIFPQIQIPESYVSAYKKHKELLKNKPLCLITILEACSGYLDISPQEGFVTEQSISDKGVSRLGGRQIANIKKLFSSACEIIVTAGEPGKNTYATSRGSFFTNSLVRAMEDYVNMKQSRAEMVTWKNLLEQASVYTQQLTRNTPIQYHPVWESRNCNELIPQYVKFIKGPEERAVSISVESRKRLSIFNRYGAKLTIENKSGIEIDSVVWYLDSATFKHPVVKNIAADTKFLLKLTVYDDVPIKAKIYFHDGIIHDVYKNLHFKSSVNKERD